MNTWSRSGPMLKENLCGCISIEEAIYLSVGKRRVKTVNDVDELSIWSILSHVRYALFDMMRRRKHNETNSPNTTENFRHSNLAFNASSSFLSRITANSFRNKLYLDLLAYTYIHGRLINFTSRVDESLSSTDNCRNHVVLYSIL